MKIIELNRGKVRLNRFSADLVYIKFVFDSKDDYENYAQNALPKFLQDKFEIHAPQTIYEINGKSYLSLFGIEASEDDAKWQIQFRLVENFIDSWNGQNPSDRDLKDARVFGQVRDYEKISNAVRKFVEQERNKNV